MTGHIASTTQRRTSRRSLCGRIAAALATTAAVLALATPASAQSTGLCAVLDGIDQLNDGFFGGGQVGYNWQTGNIVFGLEADLSAGDISNSASASAGGVTFSETDKTDWFGSIRGRVTDPREFSSN